jgi:hypothetical protein
MAPPKKRRGRPPKIETKAVDPMDALKASVISAVSVGASRLLDLLTLPGEENEKFGEGYRDLMVGFARASSLYYDALTTSLNTPMRDAHDAVLDKREDKGIERTVKLADTIGAVINNLVTAHGVSEYNAMSIVSALFLGPSCGIGTSPIAAAAGAVASPIAHALMDRTDSNADD